MRRVRPDTRHHMTKACLPWCLFGRLLLFRGNSSCCSAPSTRTCMQASASRVSLTDVYRERPVDHPLSAPTHNTSFDLFCHCRGRRRNHRLLLHSKIKTEPYRNRGFFLKTEPKSTDLAKCETVTTLCIIHQKHTYIILTPSLLYWCHVQAGSCVPLRIVYSAWIP